VVVALEVARPEQHPGKHKQDAVPVQPRQRLGARRRPRGALAGHTHDHQPGDGRPIFALARTCTPAATTVGGRPCSSALQRYYACTAQRATHCILEDVLAFQHG